jgi:hypothetical protein
MYATVTALPGVASAAALLASWRQVMIEYQAPAHDGEALCKRMCAAEQGLLVTPLLTMAEAIGVSQVAEFLNENGSEDVGERLAIISRA